MHQHGNVFLIDLLAPTGSGKTVIFELAIIRMLLESYKSGRDPKCIYVAPTKAKYPVSDLKHYLSSS
jgi:replicative superfamily II helicase